MPPLPVEAWRHDCWGGSEAFPSPASLSPVPLSGVLGMGMGDNGQVVAWRGVGGFGAGTGAGMAWEEHFCLYASNMPLLLYFYLTSISCLLVKYSLTALLSCQAGDPLCLLTASTNPTICPYGEWKTRIKEEEKRGMA